MIQYIVYLGGQMQAISPFFGQTNPGQQIHPRYCRHRHMSSVPETELLGRIAIGAAVIGSTYLGVHLKGLNESDPFTADALKAGSFILGNAIVSYVETGCTTLGHLSRRIVQTVSGFLLVAGGTIVSRNLQYNGQPDSLGSTLLQGTSWLLGAVIAHLPHKCEVDEDTTKEEQFPIAEEL